MIDQVFADGVVLAGGKSDFELGAYSVGGTHEDWIAPAFEGKARSETADRCENLRGKRLRRVPLNEQNRAFGLININARLTICSWRTH